MIRVRERGHRRAERGAFLLQQRRRGNRHVQVLGHERHHLPARLQDRHVGIEVDTVQALDVQDHVPVQDLVHRQCARAHASLQALVPLTLSMSRTRPAGQTASRHRGASRDPRGQARTALPAPAHDDPQFGTQPGYATGRSEVALSSTTAARRDLFSSGGRSGLSGRWPGGGAASLTSARGIRPGG